MNWSDEALAAYVDGELDAASRQRLEDELAGDALLAARVARAQALRRQIEAAFGAVLDEPLPPRLLAALRSPVTTTPPAAATVVDLDRARADRSPRPGRARPVWSAWSAMAASLLIGVFAGRALWPGTPADAWASEGGRLLARGALERALTGQTGGPAAAPDGVGLPISFAAVDGRYCRGFVLAREALAGLACRDGARWQVELLAAAPDRGTPPGGVRPAASALPEVLLHAIEMRMAGEPLDAAGERAAQARGWQR